jgi:endonuclease/exonuclease/phosphatase family metal-dependent hydrolase
VLLRTWNVNRGNALPPGRSDHLRAMIELITAGDPELVCLQELPAWGLEAIGAWAPAWQVVPARSERAHAGPLALAAGGGRLLSAPHRGRLAGLAGRGNAILIPASATIRQVATVTLNTNVFCEQRGAVLGLSAGATRAWEQPRRICHLVKYERPDRRRFLVATLQATANRNDIRLADAELERAVHFVDRHAEVEEAVIVAGDFNVVRAQSQTTLALESAPPESRWTATGVLSDNVLLRRIVATSARLWTETERTVGRVVLSDHAPLELELELTRR